MSERTEGYAGLDRFDRVDTSSAPDELLAFLDHVEGTAATIARRHRSYAHLGLGPGMAVAEIGCGTGKASRELATLIGPTGRVHGFDLSGKLIAIARDRGGAVANLEFSVADAQSLPLADATLDAWRAERVFMHLARPDIVLAEAFRVLRPGGRMVAMDQDWDTLIFDGDLPATRAITRAFADAMIAGTVARRMRPLLRDAGFTDVVLIAETHATADGTGSAWIADTVAKAAGAAGLDPTMVAAWRDDQRRRIAEDRFFMSCTHMISVGRRR